MPAPSFGVWFFTQVRGDAIGRAVFAASKAWILVLPLLWVLFVDGRRPRIPKFQRRGLGLAVASGVSIFAAILGSYALVGRHWLDADGFRQQADAAGFSSPALYAVGALYWCTVNALLEEYVWRWFTFERCAVLLPRPLSVLAAGLCFTFHHILVLAYYCDWKVTLLGSAGVWMGGVIWSWLYLRTRNIWAAWLSHVFADVAIFLIGYRLLFG